MIKNRFAAILVTGVLLAGGGTALAYADDGGSSDAPPATCPAAPASPAPQDQQGGQVDEQNGPVDADEAGAANDVNDAADAVEQEAVNPAADDESGDQQGPNDTSEEPGDTCQSGD